VQRRLFLLAHAGQLLGREDRLVDAFGGRVVAEEVGPVGDGKDVVFAAGIDFLVERDGGFELFLANVAPLPKIKNKRKNVNQAGSSWLSFVGVGSPRRQSRK
jgi:hypothetical protein